MVRDVNDNCPEISSISYIIPQPLLQIDPLFIINMTDIDSGVNGEVEFYISPGIIEK
jgi:hypothetical protein